MTLTKVLSLQPKRILATQVSRLYGNYIIASLGGHASDCSEIPIVLALPCYLVPSSRVRLMMIAMIIFLQASRSLAEPHRSVSVHFVTALMSSSQPARGMPLFIVPPPIPNIIDFSKLFSLRMICPKCEICRFFSNASNGLVAKLSSITYLLVRLAVNGIRSSLLQHHSSKLPIILLSAFLIVHDSQPHSTTGKTNAFAYSAFCCSCNRYIVIFPYLV